MFPEGKDAIAHSRNENEILKLEMYNFRPQFLRKMGTFPGIGAFILGVGDHCRIY